MPLVGAWCKIWIYFGFVIGWSKSARPRFDTSTDMGLVLVPADAEIDSVIFRLRATDQDADFPLVFEITATITPVVRIENLPCTLYNKVCQANVILTKRLIPGRLHDFAVRVRDTKGDSNSMQATISVTNATTPRDKIFPHIPSLIMVPEDTKPGKELDYLLVRANSWSGKPVYIELWQPKELFTIRQRQTPTQTRGVITLIAELDFETQSMYTLTMYATDPYTEPGKDTRNIAGLNIVVVVRDVQDVPPIFTLAPPLTRINNSVQPGDIILRVHAEDGDKGVPREITYGLVSEGNPFTPFFDISETTGEIMLAKPLEELTQITHVGAPVVLTVVAEEIRRSREEPPAQATVVDVGFLLGEPGNSPPYFESDNYITTIDENLEPGTVIMFSEPHSTRVRDEDIGKAGVFALKLEGNNGTFEINPTVAERTADFIITVRDNTLIDYELYKTLSFKIIAQEVGPATNLSAQAPVTIFLRDVNDNPPVFDEESYEVTVSENVTAGTRVIQVHATDKDTGILGSIRYTGITGQGSKALTMDPDTGLITVAMGSSLDREIAPKLLLSVEARDEDGKGNRGTVPLIVNLLDVNDNAPLFEKDAYEFTLNSDLSNFTTPAIIKAIDLDSEPPNNEVRYELIHGNYENKFYLNDITGELILRSPITKIRRKKQSSYESFAGKSSKEFIRNPNSFHDSTQRIGFSNFTVLNTTLKNAENESDQEAEKLINSRKKRANQDALYTLTARAYDLGVPHLSSLTEIRILGGAAMEARIMMFVVSGEHPDAVKTAETLAAITGGRVTVLETRPYVPQNQTATGTILPGAGNKTIVVARVEQVNIGTALVDVERIRDALAANGVGIIGTTETITDIAPTTGEDKTPAGNVNQNPDGQTTNINNTITNIHNDEVVVYKAENKLLFWLLIILGLLMILAITILIICCICPNCPFYMAPRKRRVHSSETLIVRSDGRPKKHLHRKPAASIDGTWNGKKQAWSADPTRRNWQFNRRNAKNCGLASLPGDVAYISGRRNETQVNADVRMRDGSMYDQPGRGRIHEQEGMYLEDVEAQKDRRYDDVGMESMQRHETDRNSANARQGYRQRFDSRYMETDINGEIGVREQHFYREGNAEVLRLVTRGQIDEAMSHHHHYHRHPTTLVVDGKDILLRRFMEDQKSRSDIPIRDPEAARSMESHKRSREICQQQSEIILIPERLDVGQRQHVDELGPAVQRLIIDHNEYETQKLDGRASQIKETPRLQETVAPRLSSTTERPSVMSTERPHPPNVPYSFHDLELAKQNVLLTRLLLERENRHIGGGVVDSASYLETQSLPGQVAIATQTDRTAATQTERHVRSRSDNDESDEEAKHKRKLKSRKRYDDSDWKRTRTLWMKSPIVEEDGPCFDKRLSILRKKVKEVKEGRKVPLEADVLKEISDSLNGNDSSNQVEEEESTERYQKSTQQTSIRYKILNEDESLSSPEVHRARREKIYTEKHYGDATDHRKIHVTESTSSPEIKSHHEKCTAKPSEKSPRKEMKTKSSKKSESSMKPSFRILEKEITMLTKKLSKLSDKKLDESTDSPSQEKSETTRESRKETDQKFSRKSDTTVSRGQKEATTTGTSKTSSDQITATRKEASIAKTRQKLKYQQSQLMSTGSSEYEDTFEKPKKQIAKVADESVKQKQIVSHQRVKRQPHVEQHDAKKQSSQVPEENNEAQEQIPVKESQREIKPEKPSRVSRASRLPTISRAENLQESSASTSSSQANGKRSMHSRRDYDKKSTSETSDNGSNGSDHRKPQKVLQQVNEETTAPVEPANHLTLEQKGIEQQVVQERADINLTEETGVTGMPQTIAEEQMAKNEHIEEKNDQKNGDEFLKGMPCGIKEYVDELTSAAMEIAAAEASKKQENDKMESEETFQEKKEDELKIETTKDVQPAAEGKLDESIKDDKLLKSTEKQVEETLAEKGEKTEERTETRDTKYAKINVVQVIDEMELKEALFNTTDKVVAVIDEVTQNPETLFPADNIGEYKQTIDETKVIIETSDLVQKGTDVDPEVGGNKVEKQVSDTKEAKILIKEKEIAEQETVDNTKVIEVEDKMDDIASVIDAENIEVEDQMRDKKMDQLLIIVTNDNENDLQDHVLPVGTTDQEDTTLDDEQNDFKQDTESEIALDTRHVGIESHEDTKSLERPDIKVPQDLNAQIEKVDETQEPLRSPIKQEKCDIRVSIVPSIDPAKIIMVTPEKQRREIASTDAKLMKEDIENLVSLDIEPKSETTDQEKKIKEDETLHIRIGQDSFVPRADIEEKFEIRSTNIEENKDTILDKLEDASVETEEKIDKETSDEDKEKMLDDSEKHEEMSVLSSKIEESEKQEFEAKLMSESCKDIKENESFDKDDVKKPQAIAGELGSESVSNIIKAEDECKKEEKYEDQSGRDEAEATEDLFEAEEGNRTMDPREKIVKIEPMCYESSESTVASNTTASTEEVKTSSIELPENVPEDRKLPNAGKVEEKYRSDLLPAEDVTELQEMQSKKREDIIKLQAEETHKAQDNLEEKMENSCQDTSLLHSPTEMKDSQSIKDELISNDSGEETGNYQSKIELESQKIDSDKRVEDLIKTKSARSSDTVPEETTNIPQTGLEIPFMDMMPEPSAESSIDKASVQAAEISEEIKLLDPGNVKKVTSHLIESERKDHEVLPAIAQMEQYSQIHESKETQIEDPDSQPTLSVTDEVLIKKPEGIEFLTPSDLTKSLDYAEKPGPATEIAKEEKPEECNEDKSFIVLEDKSKLAVVESLLNEQSSYEILPDELVKLDEDKRTVDHGLDAAEKFGSIEDNGESSLDEAYAYIDLPIFTSAIDALDLSDDSDSSLSSDISRKTALTTRPYHTPRSRSRNSPAKESTGTESEISKSQDVAPADFLESEDEIARDIFDDNETDDNVEKNNSECTLTDDTECTNLANIEASESVNSSEISTDVNTEQMLSKSDSQLKIGENELSAKQVPEKQLLEGSNLKLNQKDSRVTEQRQVPLSSTSKGQGKDVVKSTEKILKQPEKITSPSRKKKIPRNGGGTKSDNLPEKLERVKSKFQRTVYSNIAKKKEMDKNKQKDAEQSKRRHSEQPSRTETELDRRRYSEQGKQSRKPSIPKSKEEKEKKPSTSSEKFLTPSKYAEIDTSKARPKYMAWYKKNREEMEKRRSELKPSEDDEQLPRWLRRSIRRSKTAKEKKKKSTEEKTPESTPRGRRKVKPLVNVESEQLKAIVRQGRKLRKAEGGVNEDPPVQIFATSPPATSFPEPKHHLVQHSEYKYEKMPPPFYLHPPPPPPHPSPQLSPERFDPQVSVECEHRDGEFETGINIHLQPGGRLRHQQLLEKKSVFDIAYNEAAPSQLRPDSTTPPS